MKEVLHLFGVSEKVIPKVDLQISYLPQSHISPTHPFDLPTHPRGGGKKCKFRPPRSQVTFSRPPLLSADPLGGGGKM